jgi:1,4-alpha-glucan branching enzyme
MQTMEKTRAARGSAKKETFSYFAPEAESVELVGDFTNWEESPISLKRSKDGTWKAIVSLDPGTHEYRLKVDGEWRNDPDCARRQTNPFGEENCIREVS